MTDSPKPIYTSRLTTDKNPIIRFVHSGRLRTDLKLVRRFGGPGRAFLDYGCGDGLIVRGAASAYDRVVGVDIHPGAIVAARQLGVPPNGAFGVVEEIDTLAASHGPFDTIGIFQVLEHVSDEVRDKIFDTFSRVSSADSTLIVEVPIESGPGLLVKNAGAHVLFRITRKRYKRYRLSLRELRPHLSLRNAPHIRPPSDTVFRHKDFSIWNLKTYLESRLRIVETRFLPVNALRWVNLQAIFVCRWR